MVFVGPMAFIVFRISIKNVSLDFAICIYIFKGSWANLVQMVMHEVLINEIHTRVSISHQ